MTLAVHQGMKAADAFTKALRHCANKTKRMVLLAYDDAGAQP